MPRTILITEGASPLGGALTRLLVARGCTIVTLRDGPAREAAPRPRESEDRAGPSAAAPSIVAIPWNRKSPVSARAALVAARNAVGSIDEAIVLEPPPPPSARLHEAASADIERAFDEAKGPAFIAREILSLFIGRGGGVLAMVSAGPAAGPLESGVRECFRGIASSLLAGPGAAGIVVNGFQSGGADTEDYAAFIDKTLEEKARKISGRWFVCPSRGGFLQGVLAGQPRKG